MNKLYIKYKYIHIYLKTFSLGDTPCICRSGSVIRCRCVI